MLIWKSFQIYLCFCTDDLIKIMGNLMKSSSLIRNFGKPTQCHYRLGMKGQLMVLLGGQKIQKDKQWPDGHIHICTTVCFSMPAVWEECLQMLCTSTMIPCLTRDQTNTKPTSNPWKLIQNKSFPLLSPLFQICSQCWVAD